MTAPSTQQTTATSVSGYCPWVLLLYHRVHSDKQLMKHFWCQFLFLCVMYARTHACMHAHTQSAQPLLGKLLRNRNPFYYDHDYHCIFLQNKYQSHHIHRLGWCLELASGRWWWWWLGGGGGEMLTERAWRVRLGPEDQQRRG